MSFTADGGSMRDDQSSKDETRRRARLTRAIVHELFVALSAAHEGLDVQSATAAIAAHVAELGVEVVVARRNHGLCVNGIRAGLESRSFIAAEAIHQRFRERDIGGIVFEPGVAADEITARIEWIAGDGGVAAPMWNDGARIELLAPDLDGRVVFALPLPGSVSGSATDLRSVYLAKHLLDEAAGVGVIDARMARGIIKCVADEVLGHPELVNMLAEMRSAEGGLGRHGVLVAVYAVLLGRRIGLPSHLLVQLGVAALFHDIGRATVADDHVEAGYLRFASIRPLTSTVLRALLVASRHHDSVDDSRMVEMGAGGRDLFAAIVRVADIYDHADRDRDAGLDALAVAAAAGEVPRTLVDAFSDVLAVSELTG